MRQPPRITPGMRIRASQARQMSEAIRSGRLTNLNGGGLGMVNRNAGTVMGGAEPIRLAVFEILSYWQWTKNEDRTDQQAAVPEHYHRAKARPVLYFHQEDLRKWTKTDKRRTEWIYHPTGYAPDKACDGTYTRDDQRELNIFMPRSGRGDWVWAKFDDQSGRWLSIEPWQNVWRFKLLEDLPPCGSAMAQLILMHDGWGEFEDGEAGACDPTDLLFRVHDPMGIGWRHSVAGEAASSDSWAPYQGYCPPASSASGDPNPGAEDRPIAGRIVPAGTTGYAERFADSEWWEAVAFGRLCCTSSSSGSPSSPSSSESSGSSGPSSSESSRESSPSSSESSGSSSPSPSSASPSSASPSSSSGSPCVTLLGGAINADSIPVATPKAGGMVLGISEDGCWELYPIVSCTAASSASA